MNGQRLKGSYFFRTLSANDEEILVANGGDIGSNRYSDLIHDVVRAQKPDLVVIGGDIAYDNNLGECYNVWDMMLARLPHQYPEQRGVRLIPVIYGVGNHDLGKRSLSTAIYEENENSPVYKKFFPQHFPYMVDADGKETVTERRVPEMHERRTFTSHTFADKMLVLSLDAGYGEPHGPLQSNWISQKLKEHAWMNYSFTHYHNPLVPGCSKGLGESMEAGHKYWIPVFDRQGLTMSWENHVHALKRSFPIKNYKKD